MSLNREQKTAMVAELRSVLQNAGAIVAAEYPGTTVSSFTRFRKAAREQGIYVRVVKNRLARLAVKDTPFEALSAQMKGALVYGVSSDSVAVAKMFKQFAKDNESVKIKAGAIPGHVLSAKEVDQLASLPSREELLATLVGTLQAPIAKFVRTLGEVPGKFVRTLEAVRVAKAA